MNIISAVLTVLAALVSAYTILCFIDIVMSWIPGAKFTKFGRFISQMCDPYLFFFSKKGWLRFGNIDFSPIISIGLLSLLSSILSRINSTGRIYVGGILASIVSMLWSCFSSIAGIFFLLVVVRWIVLMVKKGQTSYDSVWYQLDQMIGRIAEKISKPFTKAYADYRKQLLITWIVLLVLLVAGSAVTNIVCALFYQLPF